MPDRKKSKNYLERGATHDIDNAAQLIFKSWLPLYWIVNELEKDYGKDYHIEIPNIDDKKNTGEVIKKITGDIIYVQLKGVNGAKYLANKNAVAIRLELRHLTYFCDEVKLPVFLVVVDIITKKGYWIFLQEYLANKKGWRNKQKFTLELPLSNDLENISLLTLEAYKAIKQMRILSATVMDRLDYDVKKLENVDPRFVVNPFITVNKQSFKLTPKEPIKFTLSLTKKNTDLKMVVDDLIGKGQPVQFDPGEVKLVGSPLLEDIYITGGAIQIFNRMEVTASLIFIDEAGRETYRSKEFPGLLEGGMEERYFKSNLANSPVKVEFGPLAPGRGGALTIQCNFKVWDNQQLLLLSYFDLTHRILENMVEQNYVTVECQEQGNTFYKFKVTFGGKEELRALISTIKILEMARKVAQHFKIYPIFLEESHLNFQSLAEIAAAFNIVFKNGHVYEGTKQKFNVTLSKNELKQIEKWDEALWNLKLFTDKDHSIPFMGTVLPIGRLAIEAPDCKIDLQGEEFEKLLQQEEDSVTVPFASSENTILLHRKLTKEERELLSGDVNDPQ